MEESFDCCLRSASFLDWLAIETEARYRNCPTTKRATGFFVSQLRKHQGTVRLSLAVIRTIESGRVSRGRPSCGKCKFKLHKINAFGLPNEMLIGTARTSSQHGDREG